MQNKPFKTDDVKHIVTAIYVNGLLLIHSTVSHTNTKQQSKVTKFKWLHLMNESEEILSKLCLKNGQNNLTF